MTVDTFDFLDHFFNLPTQASSYKATRFNLVEETWELSLGSQGWGTVELAPHIGQDDLRSSGTSVSSLPGMAYLQNGSGFLNFEYWETHFLGGSQAWQCPHTALQKRRLPHPPQDLFIIIGLETAKQDQNGPSPGIPILVRVPQAIPGPGHSKGYSTGTVFEETLMPKSFSLAEDNIATMVATGSKLHHSSPEKEIESWKCCRRTSSQIQAPEVPTYTHLTIEEFLDLVKNNPIQWILWFYISVDYNSYWLM